MGEMRIIIVQCVRNRAVGKGGARAGYLSPSPTIVATGLPPSSRTKSRMIRLNSWSAPACAQTSQSKSENAAN
jgi:hypothetical protein